MVSQHPIVADDGRLARRRQLGATLIDAAAEGPKSLQSRDCTILGHGGEMDESAVGKPQGQITNALRRFGVQFLENTPSISRWFSSIRSGLAL